MTASAPKITDEQAELMSALLEGEDPDCWVCIPAAALVGQIKVAAHETRNRNGQAAGPGELSARLIRNLGQIGFTKNTIHSKPEAPHSKACYGRERHRHGLACAHDCPSCGGVPQ